MKELDGRESRTWSVTLWWLLQFSKLTLKPLDRKVVFVLVVLYQEDCLSN